MIYEWEKKERSVSPQHSSMSLSISPLAPVWEPFERFPVATQKVLHHSHPFLLVRVTHDVEHLRQSARTGREGQRSEGARAPLFDAGATGRRGGRRCAVDLDVAGGRTRKAAETKAIRIESIPPISLPRREWRRWRRRCDREQGPGLGDVELLGGMKGAREGGGKEGK